MADTFWVAVLRSFDACGVTLQVGDLVDAASWDSFRRERLINQRLVRPATAQEVAAAESEEAETITPLPPKAKVRSKKR